MTETPRQDPLKDIMPKLNVLNETNLATSHALAKNVGTLALLENETPGWVAVYENNSGNFYPVLRVLEEDPTDEGVVSLIKAGWIVEGN